MYTHTHTHTHTHTGGLKRRATGPSDVSGAPVFLSVYIVLIVCISVSMCVHSVFLGVSMCVHSVFFGVFMCVHRVSWCFYVCT